MVDVVFSFGGEVENYNNGDYDYKEAFVEEWTDDFDVCDFMYMIFDMMYYGIRHYIGHGLLIMSSLKKLMMNTIIIISCIFGNFDFYKKL